ncbi:Exocyst complex component 2 [Varanus komodoensis]|nr:Exocyst complex component 2 [Varanus komodoensis]
MTLKYFGHLMRRKDSLEKSLMLGTIDGKRRRGQQRMRWLDGVTEAVGVRNYLKEALVHIIAVHAEVFTISKELVQRVLSRIVEAVAEELSRLMQCDLSFSRNGALQARLEICALRDAVAVYLTSESNSSFKQALEALPQLSSGGDKKLLEELLNTFRSSMQLQLTCFQAAASTMVKT